MAATRSVAELRCAVRRRGRGHARFRLEGQGRQPGFASTPGPLLRVGYSTPQVQYDVMDVSAPGYATDHEALAAAVSELEHRLGALIIQVGSGAW